MKIINFDYDTSHGFAFMTVEGRKTGETMSVQCCLFLKEVNQDTAEIIEPEHEAKIITRDCGHTEGLCADANADAFQFWGENRCMNALFGSAEIAGIELA